MKTVFRSLVAKPYVVAFSFAVAPLVAIAQGASAQTSSSSLVAPLNASSSTKTTPAKNLNRALDADLRAAVKAADATKVRSLLKRGADANAKNTDPDATPLLCSAASFGRLDIVRALIQAGANVNARSKINATPLFYACDGGDVPDARMKIARMLVNAGADVSVVASHNKKIASQAAASNKLYVVEKYLVGIYNRDAALYNVGAKVLGETKTVTSSTRWARWQEVKSALAKGANPRFASPDGFTTLSQIISALSPVLATLPDNDVTVKTLMARSDLNAQDFSGYSALHFAAQNGNVKMVGWLIKAGAKPNLRSQANLTPLDLAKIRKHADVVILLEKVGAKTSK